MSGTRVALPGVRTWRRMDSVARFALYFRLSMHMLVAAFLLLAISLPFTPELTIEGQVASTGAPLAIAVLLIVLLAIPAIGALELDPEFNVRPRPPVGPWRKAAGITCIAVAMVGLSSAPAAPPWDTMGAILIPSAALAASAAVIPWMPYRWVVLALAALIAGVSSPAFGFFVVVLGTTTMVSVWSVRIVKEADRARHLEAALKVSEERLRFAQELHDTLGQHLAAMSLKAELARALAARNDDRLDGQLVELQALAKTSMAEMRDVVEGYRTINLATEIEGAQSLLQAADVQTTVTGDSFDVPEAHRELAAWFLREATTNILKHSSATHATIELGAHHVIVTNNGAHSERGPARGLGALKRRAEATGSSISTTREGTTFRTTLTFEGAPQ